MGIHQRTDFDLHWNRAFRDLYKQRLHCDGRRVLAHHGRARGTGNDPGTWTGSSQTATIPGLTVQLQTFNLPFGTANSLLTKLHAAEASGPGSAACSDLSDFIAEVHAQSGKKLTVAQANQLIAIATQVEAAEGCS